MKGEWVGKGAESLGLSGEVRPEDFEALRVNLRPDTGERLTPRTKEMRQPTLCEAAQAFRAKEGRRGTAQEIANFRLTMKPVSNRVAFFDFQCSAQKSVSILAVLGGDSATQDRPTSGRRAIALVGIGAVRFTAKEYACLNDADGVTQATFVLRHLPTMPAALSIPSCTPIL